MAKLAKAKLNQAKDVFLSHGAKEVYLFGSRKAGGGTVHSDVDFAVVGLPISKFFQAMGEVMETVGLPVDLVDLDQDTSFTRYLRNHGDLVRLA